MTISVYDAMHTLKAVRRLRPDPVADDVLERVLHAATCAPTGGNRQPWRVVVVRDREKMRALGDLYAERWRHFVTVYKTVMDALPAAQSEFLSRAIVAGNYLADHFHEVPVLVVFCFDPTQMAITDLGQPRVSVVGGASIYTAVQNLLLACRAEGLGCVLTTLLCEREPEVRALLAIPDAWGTAAAIPIGHPVGRGHGPVTRKPISEMAYADSFGQPLALRAER